YCMIGKKVKYTSGTFYRLKAIFLCFIPWFEIRLKKVDVEEKYSFKTLPPKDVAQAEPKKSGPWFQLLVNPKVKPSEVKPEVESKPVSTTVRPSKSPPVELPKDGSTSPQPQQPPSPSPKTVQKSLMGRI